MNPLDDLPVSGSGAYNFTATLPTEVTFEAPDTSPLETRLGSTSWKTKVQALQELESLILTQDIASYGRHASALVSLVRDPNITVSDSALPVLSAAVRRKADIFESLLEPLVTWLVEKGVSSAKTATKSASLELILDVYERVSEASGIVKTVLSTLSHKSPKVQSSGLQVLTLLLKTFGHIAVPVFEVLEASIKLAGSTTPIVRSDALASILEAYRWIRDSVFPRLETLKKTQIDELKAAFQNVVEPAVPLRFPKRQISTQAAKVVNVETGFVQAPKDVFDTYTESWVESVLSQEKWTIRKDALESVNRDIESYPLVERSPAALVTLVKRALKDPNLLVSVQGVKLAGLLAKGQGLYFEPFARQLVPLLMLKLKDKKPQMVSEVQKALLNLLFSLKIWTLSEDFSVIFNEKLPSAKVNSLGFFLQATADMTKNDAKAGLKTFAGNLKGLMEDTAEEVRKTAVKVMAAMISKAGEDAETVLNGLPANKIKEVKDAIDGTQEIPIRPVPNTSKPVENRQKPVLGKRQKEVIQRPEDSSEPANNPVDDSTVESVVSSFLPENIVSQLGNPSWKEKQAGFLLFGKWVEENKETVQTNQLALVKFIEGKCKHWKENNMNILKAGFEALETVASNSTLDSRTIDSLITLSILDKLTDPKLSPVYLRLLILLSSQSGPRRPCVLLCKETESIPKPKVVTEVCDLLKSLVSEFGTQRIDLGTIVTFAKGLLTGSNAGVKKAAHGLIVTLYIHTGEKMLPLLSDVNKHAFDALSIDFKNAKTNVEQGVAYREVAVEDQPPKGLISTEKTNLSGKVTRNLMQMMNSAAWKERKEALEALDTLVSEANGPILATGLSDLVQMLKLRLTDPNKTLLKGFLLFIGKLGEALGSEGRIYTKTLLPGVVNSLMDKQVQIRQVALQVLEQWSKIADPDTTVSICSQALLQDNADLRLLLLQWLMTFKDHMKKTSVQVLLPGLLQCLQDRTAAIRNAAELVLAEIMDFMPIDMLETCLQDLKPTIVNSLKPILEKHRKNEGKKGNKTQGNKGILKTQATVEPMGLITWLELSGSEQMDVFSAEVAAAISVEQGSRYLTFNISACAASIRQFLRTSGLYPSHSLVLKWLRLLWTKSAQIDFNGLRTVLDALIAKYTETGAHMTDPELRIIVPFLTYEPRPQEENSLESVLEALGRVSGIGEIFNILVDSLLTEERPGFQGLFSAQVLINNHSGNLEKSVDGQKLRFLFEKKSTKSIGKELIRRLSEACSIDKFWDYFGNLPTMDREVLEGVLNSTRIPVGLKPRKSVTFALNPSTETRPFSPSHVSFSSIPEIISNLLEGGLTEKVEALVSLHEVTKLPDGNERVSALLKYADSVVNAFQSVFQGILKSVPLPMTFARFNGKVLAVLCSQKRFSGGLSVRNLGILTEMMVKTMVNREVLTEETVGKETVSAILNKGMVLLMENADTTNMLVALFQVITRYSVELVLARMVPTLIKCVLKLTRVLDVFFPSLRISELLLCMYQVLSTVPRPSTESKSGDDSVAKTVKTVLFEIIRLRKEKIWEDYAEVMGQMTEDRNISRWILTMAGNMGIETGSVYQRLRSPLKARGLGELAAIFEKVKEETTYQEGVQELFSYIQKHPDCELVEYTRGRDVLNARLTADLQKLKFSYPPQDPERQSNPLGFRNRMDQIKTRFNMTDIGPLENQPKSENSLTSVEGLKRKLENLKAGKGQSYNP